MSGASFTHRVAKDFIHAAGVASLLSPAQTVSLRFRVTCNPPFVPRQ